MKLKLLIILPLLFGCNSQKLTGSITGESIGQNSSVFAKVRIIDSSGSVVSGAVVTGQWSGVVNGQAAGLTDNQGVATLISPPSKTAGTYTITVVSVVKSGMNYNPSLNHTTQASIAH